MEEWEDLLVHFLKIIFKKLIESPSVRQEKCLAAIATIHDGKTTCYSKLKALGY